MTNFTKDDLRYMARALDLAEESVRNGNKPFGALIVKDDEIVIEAVDLTITESDPTAHPEILVIQRLCREKGLDSLLDHVLYTSTEPCFMCTGAVYWSWLSKVVYSAPQSNLQQVSKGPKKYGCVELLRSYESSTKVVPNVLIDRGVQILENYFSGE